MIVLGIIIGSIIMTLGFVIFVLVRCLKIIRQDFFYLTLENQKLTELAVELVERRRIGEYSIITTTYFGADELVQVVDFSREEDDLLGFTMYMDKEAETLEERERDGKPYFVSRAIVYEYENHYSWEAIE